MNFGELKSFIRQNTSDRLGGILKPGGEVLYINSAFKKIQDTFISRKIYFNISEVTVSFTADERETDIGGAGASTNTSIRIKKIIFVENNNVPIVLLDKTSALQSSTPAVYWVEGIGRDDKPVYKLGYYIVPETTFDAIVHYIPPVGGFAQGDSDSKVLYDTPEKLHELVGFYATMLILSRDRTSTVYQNWAALYQDELQLQLSSAGLGSIEDAMVVDVYDN